MNKRELQQNVQDVEAVLADAHLSDSTLAKELQEKRGEIHDFRAKVPVVGAFSAGKSALLNAFMGGEEILAENISMETAIATELCYSEAPEPYAIRVKKDGTEERCTLAEAKAENPSDCKKYIFCLPNESLSKMRDITLVDMPGYSSGIEAHNTAIAQYIDDAAGFVYVISVNAGTFDAQSQNFLEEILQYSPVIRFILTKCDLKTAAERDEVAAVVQESLTDFLGEPVKLLKTSSRFPEAKDELLQLFSSLSADDMMLQKHGGPCCMLMMKVKAALEEQKAALSFHPSEIDAQLRENQRVRESLNMNLEAKKKERHRKMQQEGMDRVMADVSMALESGVPQLVTALQSGPDAFGNTMNSLLRPVLKNSLSDVIMDNYDDMVDDLMAQLDAKQGWDADDVADKLTSAVGTVNSLLEGAQALAKARKYTKIFKAAATGAAVMTNVVAPAVELIIIFLPDILNFLSKAFGTSPEQQMEQMIRNRVIPQVCENLRPRVMESLREAEENMMREIESSFAEQMDAARETMEQLKQEKEQHQLDIEAKKQQLDAGIAKVEGAIQSIESAMQGA